MKILIILIGIFLLVDTIYAILNMTKYVLRKPKPSDIGLIFDLTIVNDCSVKKEMLELRISPSGKCKIRLSNNDIMNCANRIIGGYYGPVAPEGTEIISLIWPTASHFNRVGSCPIDIISIDTNKKATHSKQILSFDTKCTTLDPSGQNFRAQKNYKDCGNNFDLDNFKNCAPVDCIERYFGHRSYFNETTKMCEEVPRCVGPHQSYDKWQNECVDSEKFCDEDDVQKIRQGQFKTVSPGSPMTCTGGPHKSNKMNIDDNKTTNKRETESDYDFFSNVFGLAAYQMPDWLTGLGNGFLVVLATLVIYIAICFLIFLIINWISRRDFWDNSTPIQLEADKKAPSPDCYCDKPNRRELSTSSLLSLR